MEPLSKQFTTLSQKIDALYQVVNLLNGQVGDALSECRLTPIQDGNGNFLATENTGRYPSLGYSSHEPTMQHKDVLTDHSSKDAYKSGKKGLTQEIQVRRLTAQLTAAYNRIAALEEQILAQRTN